MDFGSSNFSFYTITSPNLFTQSPIQNLLLANSYPIINLRNVEFNDFIIVNPSHNFNFLIFDNKEGCYGSIYIYSLYHLPLCLMMH